MENRYKFRVYDKDTQEMVYVNGIWGNRHPYTECSSFAQYESVPRNHKMSEPMQCLGFEDSQGNLIYSGGICVDKNNIKSEIISFNGFFMFNGSIVTGRVDGCKFGIYGDELTIVDNIYGTLQKEKDEKEKKERERLEYEKRKEEKNNRKCHICEEVTWSIDINDFLLCKDCYKKLDNYRDHLWNSGNYNEYNKDMGTHVNHIKKSLGT